MRNPFAQLFLLCLAVLTYFAMSPSTSAVLGTQAQDAVVLPLAWGYEVWGTETPWRAGEYRTMFLDAAVGAPYSDSFFIWPGENEFRLLVRPPRYRTVRVRLCEESGASLDQVEVRSERSSHRSVSPPEPPWLCARLPSWFDFDEFFEEFEARWYRSRIGCRPQSWRLLESEGGVFSLGRFSEDSRVAKEKRRFTRRIPGETQETLVSIETTPLSGGGPIAVMLSRNSKIDLVKVRRNPK